MDSAVVGVNRKPVLLLVMMVSKFLMLEAKTGVPVEKASMMVMGCPS